MPRYKSDPIEDNYRRLAKRDKYFEKELQAYLKVRDAMNELDSLQQARMIDDIGHMNYWKLVTEGDRYWAEAIYHPKL